MRSERGNDVIIVLVGNKADLSDKRCVNASVLAILRFLTSTHDRQVTVEEATTKATQMNIMFMETSAKAGHNVKGLFKKIAMSLPGMDKDASGETNTSARFPVPLDCFRLTAPASEIDVTSQSGADVPEAASCNC